MYVGSACFFFSIGLAVALTEQILRESDVWESKSIHLHLSRSARWTSALSYGTNAALQQRANGCPGAARRGHAASRLLLGTGTHGSRSSAGQFLTTRLGGGEAPICSLLISVMQALTTAKFTLPVCTMYTDFFLPLSKLKS